VTRTVKDRANRGPREGRSRLTLGSAAYLVLVVAAAALLAAPFDVGPIRASDWPVFAVLAVAASVTQLLVVKMPAHQAYYSTAVFFLGAAVLLPPALVALIVVIAHIPEWVKHRCTWYIQTFNIANYVCAAVGACLVCRELIEPGHQFVGRLGQLALAGAAASVLFVLVNHTLLAQMLRLARGKSYGASGLFSVGSLSTEVVLALLGVGAAAVWELAPPLTPFVLAPLLLVHRSLELPGLQAAARLDPKTELFNARYFATAFENELERAKRFDRPLAILLADLDLLRNVNNTHGHLAGDAVLRGVADVFRAELRPFDIAGRFGGEEYAVVLPEAGRKEALATAERIRRAVEETPFELPGGGSVQATVSLGIATFPEGDTVDELIHRADLALYRSKAVGRNRVSAAPTPPVALPVEQSRPLQTVGAA
jgi:diguanylate cyclase (GGDEF)-like protein